MNMWMNITMDIYRMEKMTADVNYKRDLFVSRWKKWMDYIKKRRPVFAFALDFDFVNY